MFYTDCWTIKLAGFSGKFTLQPFQDKRKYLTGDLYAKFGTEKVASPIKQA